MRRRLWSMLGALCVFCAACTSTSGSTTTTTTSRPPTESVTLAPAVAGETTAAPDGFRETLDEIARGLLIEQPELVTELGAGAVIGFDSDYLLNDVSARGQAALAALAEDGLQTLDGIETSTDAERLSTDILRWYLEDLRNIAQFAEYENPVNFITGAHAGFAEYMADVHPLATEQDAENYVDRLNEFPGQLDDLVERLEAAAASGIVPAERSLDIARYQIGVAIGDGDIESHPLVSDFLARVEAIPGENSRWAAGIGARAAAVVDKRIVPALRDLDDAVRDIDGRSDQRPGVLNLPGGAEYYAAVLRHHLSIDMTPEQVHQTGLDQVGRLVAELAAALDTLGYDAGVDFAGAMRQAAADAGSLPTRDQTQRAAVLDRTIATVDRANAVFSDMFTVRPLAELEVVRPRPGREGGSGAYYRPPPIDASRSGQYYLSLGGNEFGVLTMDTTTYHEAIPGHHFQLSVQRSLEDLPLHQRVFDFAGYVEGWALYAERLAHEAGLYDDAPLGNIGRLRMELLRAVRMVVDTGIHWAGWTRSEAVEYMTGLGFDNGMATAEVDRYIVWPGQAPAYMVGMLEIVRLREEAQSELGERFDLIGFHDALLSQGSVPVALLEDVVGTWVLTSNALSG